MPSHPPAKLPLSGDKSSGKAPASGSLNVKKPAKTGESEPLAPKSFKNPKPKKGNGRKIIAVVFGSLIVIFLMGAIGLVGFRFFAGEEEVANQTGGGSGDSRATAREQNKAEEKPVDLGAWTTPPPCLDVKDSNVWIEDEDNDLLTNAEERLFGTDPCNIDSNGNGVTDGEDIRDGQDPLGEGRFDYAKYGLPDPEAN